MAEVVNIVGGTIVDHRKAVDDVVETCKRLMEMAESGEICGACVVVNYHDGSTGLFRSGVLTYSTIGRAEAAKMAMLNDLGA